MLTVDIHGVQELELECREMPDRLGRSMLRAQNRAIDSAQTLMVRSISGDMGLKAGDVRKALRVQHATFGRLIARLAASLERIPLFAFNARGPLAIAGGSATRRRGGVTAKLIGGAGVYPHAFIVEMRSGHRGVFERVGKRRLKISERFGPSIGHVFAKYRPQALSRAQEIFERTFDHEMEFRGAAVDAGAD